MVPLCCYVALGRFRIKRLGFVLKAPRVRSAGRATQRAWRTVHTTGRGIFPRRHGHLLYKKTEGVFVSYLYKLDSDERTLAIEKWHNQWFSDTTCCDSDQEYKDFEYDDQYDNEETKEPPGMDH